MEDARTFLNLLISSWGTDTPNLWTVDQETVNLVAGTATYDAAVDTIMILDAYIRTGDPDDSENITDRIIWPLSRSAYAAMPNKNLQSPPTSFWFDRQLAPTVTLWPVPDESNSVSAYHQLVYYRCTVIEDADAKNGITMDIPRWWQLATVLGLAELLAMQYATDRVAGIAAKASTALKQAQDQDVENTPLTIAPALNTYYPR